MSFGSGQVALCYTVVGLTWILFSDRLVVSAFKDAPDILLRFSIYKGFGFVFSTAVLLYFLLRWHVRAYQSQERALRESQERYRMVVE